MATFGPLPRERTTKALVSLQRVIARFLRSSAVLVKISEKLTDLNASTSSEVAIDEDDQLILSFVTSFLSEANEGCEIHGYLS